MKSISHQNNKNTEKIPNIWKPLGGSSRNYVNLETGEILSRRQFDRRYGSLAKANFTSYEKKAQANKKLDIELQKSRPARGRQSTIFEYKEKKFQDTLKNSTKNLRPKKYKSKNYKSSRGIFIPYSEHDYIFFKRIENVIEGVKSNYRIFGASINIVYKFKNREKAVNIFPTYARKSIPVAEIIFQEVQDWMEDHNNSNDVIISGLDIHIIFSSKIMSKLNG